MQKLKTMGKIVYLKHKFEVIQRRLGDLKKRGVALKEGFTLKDLYEERTPLYEKYADIVVEMPDGTKAEAVNAVIEALKA